MLVRDVMTAHPVTVKRETAVTDALRALRDHRITALPVVSKEGQLCGMVSEIDLIRDRVLADPRAHEIPLEPESVQPPSVVAEVMTPLVVAVRDSQELREAVDVMAERSLKSLPVLDFADRLVGIVSRSDVARALAREDSLVAAELTTILADLGYDDWLVDVAHGIAYVAGPATPKERTLAETVAATVPGVVRIRVTER